MLTKWQINMSPHFFAANDCELDVTSNGALVSLKIFVSEQAFSTAFRFLCRNAMLHSMTESRFGNLIPVKKVGTRQEVSFHRLRPRAAKLFLQIVLTNPISKYAEVGLPNKKVTTEYLFPAVDDFRFDPLINMIGINLISIAFAT